MPKQKLQRDRGRDTSDLVIHCFFSSQTLDSLTATDSTMALAGSPHRALSLGSPSSEPYTEEEDSQHSGFFCWVACATGIYLATDVSDTLPADLRKLLNYIPMKGDIDALADCVEKSFQEDIASLQQTTTRLTDCIGLHTTESQFASAFS